MSEVTLTPASIAEALAEEEARLRRLDAERTEVTARAEALRARLATLDPRPPASAGPPVATAAAPESAAEKVKLFRLLFRGRDDVYPTRFVSKKTGKAGYAPACANKFVVGVCPLPKVKCGDCTNQAFRPIDDRTVREHLQGKHVLGIYPMLPDETCWFLAVDFDKGSWKDDIRAFAETARRLDLPVLVERSRSGDGAHAWFFFSEPVPAALARKMGCHVITETMSARHELSMDSYDRLFPSQDTMPRGGFGNLIALPLQHEPRQHGNSVFLDEELQPFPDDQQWSVLVSAKRISLATVERIASDASRSGTVIGLRIAETDDDDAPWTRAPSGVPRVRRLAGPLPARVSVVLAQRLFVAREGLPSPLLNQMKRVAGFQNPEFYKKQSMRLSTATTPRVIACAEDLPNHVALPRGCRLDLEELLRGHGIALDIVDQRTSGAPLDVRFRGTLTPVQESAARALLAHEMGVFVAPPGVGKTVIGTYLVAARARSTLILVHRRPLLDQWLAQLALFLGVDAKAIGQIRGAKRAPTGRIDVAMIQSLVRKESVADLVAAYGQIIVDECHHLPAVQFERVLREVKARYVIGLTATPQRRDGHHPITEMQLGGRVDHDVQVLGRPGQAVGRARERAGDHERNPRVIERIDEPAQQLRESVHRSLGAGARIRTRSASAIESSGRRRSSPSSAIRRVTSLSSTAMRTRPSGPSRRAAATCAAWAAGSVSLAIINRSIVRCHQGRHGQARSAPVAAEIRHELSKMPSAS